MHKLIRHPSFQLKQCFFGERLLKQENKDEPVGIVESEKTALIASVFCPDIIWLATGGLANLNIENCKILEGRNVTLYPDTNCYDNWSEKGRQLLNICNATTSDLLEVNATQQVREEGYDLADYLLPHKNQSSPYLPFPFER